MELVLDSLSLPRAPVAATMPAVAANDVTDGELIRRTGDGDRNAFEVLYRRYSRPVFGLALRRLGDRGRAEDAVQETFASIWRAARSYRPERGPGAPWLYAVARNAIIDRGRVRNEPPTDPPEEASTDVGPDEQAEAELERLDDPPRARGALAQRARAVIELAYWSGLSQSEVAEYLGIPLGTVKTRTRAALAHLADQLEEELG